MTACQLWIVAEPVLVIVTLAQYPLVQSDVIVRLPLTPAPLTVTASEPLCVVSIPVPQPTARAAGTARSRAVLVDRRIFIASSTPLLQACFAQAVAGDRTVRQKKRTPLATRENSRSGC
jgi:hypothetical protein